MQTLALIGVGRWGENIISTLETVAEAHLKYLCNRSPESLALYGDKYEKISDWREILNKNDLDAVIIATPPSAHAEMAAAFLKRGLSVFVEKPMALNVFDALNLQSLVRKSSAIFMVGYEYLFNVYINYLKKEIKKETFGKIIELRSEHFLSPLRPDVDIFWDAGPHPLSVFQYLFEPKNLLSAAGKIEHNRTLLRIEFKNAPALEIIASCFGEKKTRKLIVSGEKATAVLDETLEKDRLAITENGKIRHPRILGAPPLRNELEHFVHCLQTGKTPLTNVDFGTQITEWLETISKKVKN